jgi:acyl transferase domain-containing protein
MLAIGMSYEEAQAFLATHGAPVERVCVAAVNSPSACTLAGTPDEIEAVQKKLETAGTFNRVLRVNIGFHSPLTEPIKDEFFAKMSGIRNFFFNFFSL